MLGGKMKKKITFVIRQKGKYSKYCYYRGFDGKKHRWTKKLKKADLFLSATEAFEFKNKLKFNNPRVMAILTNGANRIVRIFKPTKKKYCIKGGLK